MPTDEPDPERSHRQRAGETKRARTRQALIDAATIRFSTDGWRATRFEDIAAEAQISAATAYKHFTGKGELVAVAYRPLLEDVWARAANYIATGTPAIDAVEMHLHDLNAAVRANLPLTLPFLEAVWDALVRFGTVPNDPTDPRVIVDMPQSLIEIVTAGQHRDELSPWPTPQDAAIYIINGMMLQIATHHDETAGETARIAFRFARGALLPNGDRDRHGR